MRIIHIVHGKVNPNSANGISRVVYFLNKHQKALGLQSEIWAFVDGQKSHETYVRDEYVTVELFPRLNLLSRNHPMIERFTKEKDSIDIVHFHMIWFTDKNILAKQLNLLKIPFIAMTHGTYSKPVSYKGKKQIARYLLECPFLNRASAIHALTPEEITYLTKYGVDRPSFVIPNGIDINQIPLNIRSDYFADKSYSNKIKIGWIGVFREDKNLDLLAKACSLLPKEIRDLCHFVLLGPDHKSFKNKLAKQIKGFGCESSFEILDAVYNEEKYSALNSFDLYIMPSSSEGMSMAILDAMALGKPCILTRGCNMTYYYNRNFYEMCECIPQEIAKAIVKMVQKKDKWSEMGTAAKKLINDEFNWDIIAQNLTINYQEIIKNEL